MGDFSDRTICHWEATKLSSAYPFETC